MCPERHARRRWAGGGRKFLKEKGHNPWEDSSCTTTIKSVVTAQMHIQYMKKCLMWNLCTCEGMASSCV